ncbi:hypothetical protein MTX26_03895 [Bradyrhizobium sp. ISRA443]|uniref:hypothetical protein n=1 Tax=unclassified Bradyrhizobium TaxID=2631580 RepID=UPI00247A7B47|nr:MULTISPECIES: hypothetical protein [unclassified Bradyrhizobium]WGS00014.1 hypothetical protein MTX23_03895 [Bradyrhizobium sp. ISRA436]WGS06904.1 hypothetical protein MTX18_03895 [Bradyrhizobium sp. ISRA437]WGS13786.1 hypothetical protein MTX26_03895 [Bradyrhizobium sp. ISRA443]
MSTSTKTRASIRQGGPGAAHENAKAAFEIRKPTADDPLRRHSSKVSGGGGERDHHHAHRPSDKGGGTRRPQRGSHEQACETEEAD